MSSPYPRDDFDAVAPPRDGRRGAHRAAPRRPGGVLAPVVIALVVAAAGGVGYVAWTTVGGPTPSASAAPPAQDPASAAQDPAPAGGPAASPEAPASASPTASDDRSAPVVVLNGTGTSGLAAKQAEELEAQGWKVSSTGNATTAQRSAHRTTTVLYPTAQLEGSATALAAQVGAEAALDEQAQAGSLTVLLR